jgi:hypothetical protein
MFQSDKDALLEITLCLQVGEETFYSLYILGRELMLDLCFSGCLTDFSTKGFL